MSQFFYLIWSEHQTQVLRLGAKGLYPQSHLLSPVSFYHAAYFVVTDFLQTLLTVSELARYIT